MLIYFGESTHHIYRSTIKMETKRKVKFKIQNKIKHSNSGKTKSNNVDIMPK